MSAPHILIFEPEATGHQMEYVRYILEEIESSLDGARVTLLTTAEAAAHANCQTVINAPGRALTVAIMPEVEGGHWLFRKLAYYYERQWVLAESLCRWLDADRARTLDYILIPHLESVGMIQLVLRPGFSRGVPWGTIAIALRFHLEKAGVSGASQWRELPQRLLFELLIRRRDLTFFGSVSPYAEKTISNPRVVHCPEPSAAPIPASVDVARAAYGVRPDTVVVLVFGFIDRRKCLDVLLEGAVRAARDVDLTILLAGTQHAGYVAPILSGPAATALREQGRLVEVNRFIIRGVDIDPMNAADICWLVYSPEFMVGSSVIVRCGQARRPAIVRDRGVMGRQARENDLGVVLPSDDPEAVATVLRRLAADPALRERLGENGYRMFVNNTPENFARPVVAAIRDRTLAKQSVGAAA